MDNKYIQVNIPSGWICPRCGQVNAMWIGQCGCHQLSILANTDANTIVDGQSAQNDNNKKAKEVIRQAIADAALPMMIEQIDGLHPTTLDEIRNHVHQIQNILIAEYVRYTPLNDEIGLR